VLLRVILIYIAGSTPQSRNTSALRALQQLSSIAFALSHHKEQFPDDVSTYSDIDIYNRASRASCVIFILF